MSRTGKRIDKRIMTFLRATVTPVEVKGVQGLFNHKCHMNSVQYAKDNPGHSVVMGIVDDGGPILHFWVVDNNANHKDVTLGWASEMGTYYPMRVLSKEEWLNVNNVFTDGLEYWRNTQTNWFERKILRVGRVV